MAIGGNDIDSLKFSIILDSGKFEKELKRVEDLAKKFEKSVKEALTITNLLDAAQSKGAKATKEKAAIQKEIVLLTRQELEAKKAAGTITDKELKQLKQIVATDKALLDEENKKLTAQKKQLDIQDKQEKMARRRKLAEEETGDAIQLNSARLLKQNNVLRGLGSYLTQYASIFGAATVVRNLVRITGEFEAQRAALRAILQDTAAADNIFNQLQTLAVKSPFTFQNLVSYAKQLTAFSVPVNEVYETTKKLADVSAGLGVDMGRIILAYGQVRSAEFLRGQEVRQFTEAGIPILKELADQFKEIEGHAISVGEVFDRISARQVPFEMVEEAFRRMTSAGGKFYQMQEVLAETVKGKVSNLQDAWEIMLSKIGDEHSGTIKDIITGITNILANYQKWIGFLGAIIKYLGIYNAALLVLNSTTRVFNSIAALRNGLELIRNQQIKLTTMLLPTQNALEKISIKNKKDEAAAVMTLNLARKAAVGVLAALSAIIWSVAQRQARLRDEENKTADTINVAVAKLNASMTDFEIGADRVMDAFKKMKEKEGDVTDETKAFHKAVDDLKKQFPKFIDENMKLAETVDELGKYWARAREEMNQYFADEARESVHTDLQQNRDEEIKALSKNFTKSVQSWFPKKDKGTLGKNYSTMAWRYVIGDISYEEVKRIISSMNEAYQSWSGSQIDYSDKILNDFDKYVSKYQQIMERYENALDDTDNMLAAHRLSSTRQNFNEYIFSLAGTGAKGNWSLNGGPMTPFSMFSEADQERIFNWWVENDDFSFKVEDTVESWAERQREKLQSGSISDNVKSVIREVFEQFNIVENPGAVTGWRKDVNDIIDNFGDSIRSALKEMGDMSDEEIEKFVAEHQGMGSKLKVKATDQLGDLVDGWIKNLDETQKELKRMPSMYSNLQNDAYTNLWLNQLLLQTISSGLYGNDVLDFSGNTKDAKAKEKEKERERKERERKYQEYKRNQISDIKQKFSDLKELKAAYDGFKKIGFDDSQIGGLLTNFFGKGLPDGGFDAAFEALAKKMDKFSPNDAQDIRNFAAGKDWKEYATKIESAQKATEKFAESLEDLRATTKRLDLEGFAAELDKILVDADSKNRKLQTDWKQKLDDLAESKEGWIARFKVKNPGADDKAASDAWVAFYEEQKKAIDELLATQVKYNNKVAQGQIDKKADEWVKAMLDENNIDLTDWSDKTIDQINTIKERLQGLIDQLPDLIPPELQEDADTVNVTFKNLLETIEKILRLKLEDSDVEIWKKWVKYAKQIASYISNAGEAMKKLGAATGNAKLDDIGTAFEAIGQNLDAAAEGFQKSGSWIGAVVGGVVDIFNQVTEAVARSNEKMKEMENTIRNIRIEAGNTRFDEMLSGGSDTIFGENFIKRVNNAVSALDDLKHGFDELEDSRRNAYAFILSLQDNLGGLAETYRRIIDSRGMPTPDAASMSFRTDHSFWKGDTFKSLSDIAAEFNMELNDVNDNLNPQLLKKVLELYGDLNEGAKDWLADAIQYSEQYEKALEQIEDATKDLFDNSASDMTDKFIDNFLQMGNAVDDLSDTFANLGDAILRSFLQSYILDEILNKYRTKATTMLTKYSKGEMTPDEYAAWLSEFAQSVQRESETLAPAINGMIEAFKDRGLMNIDEDTANSLGSGIKGITEDTANLLASYINAIRADVSYGRTLWERIAVAVEGQAGTYITLNDYLAQVAANTYDTAQNTQRILSELQSVIGPEGTSGAIVRVQMS